MTEYKDIPLIFLAYANKSKAEDISVLEEENRKIAQILRPMEDKMACQIIQEDPENKNFFIDLASQPTYRERITIVHLAGGAYGRKYIRFASSDGEIAMDSDEFSEFIAQLPNLQLLFITRSASPRLVRKILTRTQVAVIRTEDRPENQLVPQVFYGELAKARVIKRAFGQATISCGDHLMYEMLSMAELVAPPFQRRDIYEGLYVRDDAKAVLDWRMSPSFFILGESAAAPATGGGEDRGGWSLPAWIKPAMAGITSLIGVAFLLFAIFSQLPDRLMGQISSDSVCPFPSEGETYHILILPFFETPTCGPEDRKYKTAIREQLDEFRLNNSLNLNIQFHDAKCPTSDLFAKGIGGSCNANLVIWGGYQPSQNIGETQVEVRYSTTDKYNESEFITDLDENLTLTSENFEASKPILAKRAIDIVYYGLAVKSFRENRFDQAIDLLTNIRPEAEEESYSVIDRLAAACYYRLGNYEEAIARYNTAIAIDPESEAAYIERGKTYMEMGEYQLALEDFEEALSISPFSTEVLIARGNLHRAMGNYVNALNDFNLALIKEPQNVESYYQRGLVYIDQGNLDNAMLDFDYAIQLSPSYSASFRGRAKVYERRKNFNQAFLNYSLAIMRNKQDDIAYHERGKLHIRYYRHEQGLLDLQEAIRLNPSEADYYLTRAMAYKGIGEYQGFDADTLAMADANEAIRLAPNRCEPFAYRGILHTYATDFSQASRDFAQALELDAACAPAHYGEGLLHKTLENTGKAINSFSQAIDLKPDYLEAYCERGIMYEAQNNYERALNDYNRAIEEDPDFARAYDLRADLYTMTRRYNEALEDYTFAIQKNNGIPDPFFKRGFLYTLMGRYEAAVNDVRQAMRLDRERPKYYGLLAKIYARQEKDSLFYANMDLALQKGYLMMDFEQDPSYKPYWEDLQFKEILDKYREEN